jgi:ABC-type transport system substrate-binding protein
MDAYLDRIPLIVDREEAKVAWREYQELLVDEQPYTFTYFAHRLDGVNKRLQGVVTDVRGEWQSTKDWWIPADQRRGRGR